ncbi:universal stress protein [Frigoribacterium sp. CG_9.8]|uniref:universal stress protein n=1 Tax=Frigoribacterium sp. CG_9.8 TaxID=2787733 RepID=UPI0018CBC614|nr:universal stress protein [Frigoribacterium sp. CG_9.8]MBG6108232.1 nucleotide-binding universal stress UspA family protein [Frigoribacterium sp. CG_9.8]
MQPLSDSAAPPQSPRRVGHIIVGVDGSKASLRALAKAATLADALNTELRILTTWKFFADYNGIGGTDWSPENDAREILDDASHRQFGDSLPHWVTTGSVEGSPAQRLIDASEGAEMIVLGSRGHGGVMGLLLGSVSSACAEKAHCPVLVVH